MRFPWRRRVVSATSISVFVLAVLAGGVAARSGRAQPAVSSPDPTIHDIVLVTATRGERLLLDVAGDTIVLDRQAIERSGVATIPDLLRRQPGLFVSSFTTSPAGVTVESRGFNNGGSLGSGLLVLLDGRRLNEADTGNTDWALIPIDRVDSIEIIQGSASAIYGDNAVGGVINIRTRPYSGPRATLRGRAGRYDALGGSIDAQLGAGPVSGGVFANRFDSGGYRHRSDYTERNLQGDVEWSPGKRVRLGARGGYHEDMREFPGALSRAEVRRFGRRAADPDSTRDESDVYQGFGQGWIDVELSDDVSVSMEPHFRIRRDEATITSIAFGPPSTFTIDTDKLSQGLDLRLRSDLPIAGFENRLTGGAEVLYEETDRDIVSGFGTTVSDNERTVLGAYLQEEVWVHDRVLLAAGLRYDHARYDLVTRDPGAVPSRDRDDPRFDIWSPRASLSYRFLPRESVYASYSRGFRLPNFDENAPVIGFTPLIPDLDPQISDSFELGWKHQSERVQAALALYWLEVRDEILFDPFTFQNSNLDRVRHRGLTASLNGRIGGGLSAYASYTLDDVVVRDADDPRIEGERMPITPLHRGTAGLLLELPHELELAGNLNVVGERILSNDFDRQLSQLDPYAVLDLLAAWRPRFGEHFEGALTFALRNVTDAEYEDFGARFDLGFPGTPTAFWNPAAGRTWEVGAAVTLRH